MKRNYGPIVHEGHGTTGGLYKCVNSPVNSQRNEECGQRGAVVGGCRLKNTAQKNDRNNTKKVHKSVYI